MPIDGIVDDEDRDVVRRRYEPPTGLTDDEVLKDTSVIKTDGGANIASPALKVLNRALENGRLILAGEDLPEESMVKMLKLVGKMGQLKGLLPTRISALPITEIDLSGNALFSPSLGIQESIMNAKAALKRKAETVQLVVQFIRTSTQADIIRLDSCGLEGQSHDKDDLVEQELIRLVKKFGAGKHAKYASEVSLVDNRFTVSFARRILEGAYWERNRHPNKDDMPKLKLDLRRNRIRGGDSLIEELKEGRCAGGPMALARATDPRDEREKALIIIDMSDQREGSASPPREARRPPERERRPPSPRPQSYSPPPRHSRSPPRRRAPSPPPRSPSRRRSPTPRRRGGGGRRDSRSRSPRRGGGRPRRSASRSRSDSRRRYRGGGGRRR